MRRLCMASSAVTALFLGSAVSAQPEVRGRVVYASDSAELHHPAVSPDNRWLVFTRTISVRRNQIMVRPIAGGTARELVSDQGEYSLLRFTPQGDRLVFASTAPRRTPDDQNYYLVSAPFDTKTGTLSAPPRQVTLDAIQRDARLAPAISPDGRSIAYVACCGEPELRAVPIIGGNARTLVKSSARGTMIPGWLGWTPDSRFVLHHTRGADDISIISQVSVNGGASTAVSRFKGGFGIRTADGKHFFGLAQNVDNRPPMLRVTTMDGRVLGEVKVPFRNNVALSADGTHLLGAVDNSPATLTVVPTVGGALRPIGRGDSGEWPEGWSPDGATLQYSAHEGADKVLRVASLDGKPLSRVPLIIGRSNVGIVNGQMIELVGTNAATTTFPRAADVVARDMANGKETVLMKDVVGAGVCCSVLPPGGMYYGIVGNEFYIRKVRGERLQVLGVRADGTSRVIVEVPRALLGTTGFAVHGTRAAYVEIGRDSTRLKVSPAAGKPAITIAAYPRSTRISEYSWSHDGRQLSMYRADAPRQLVVFRFTDAGTLAGAPLQLTLPFDYFYEPFWLPDGSGLTMIAQPTGGATAEIAVVKLADPANPIYPAKADPVSKWGHALSPDGKYISYPSEKRRGSALHMVPIRDILQAVGVNR
jgi:WD40-like Beta Propeller Repeat